MVDPIGAVGLVGSPVDVATFLAVVILGSRLRGWIGSLGAGVVALARREPGVDADDLQADLPVEDVDVRSVESDGGRDRDEEGAR